MAEELQVRGVRVRASSPEEEPRVGGRLRANTRILIATAKLLTYLLLAKMEG